MITRLIPTIALCGHGEAGKDESARYLTSIAPLRLGLTTSQIIAPHIAAEDGVSTEVAFARRRQERERWFRKGNELREQDPAYLVRECLRDGEIVVGLRNIDEVIAARTAGLIDLFIWIERPGPRDATMTFGPEQCDVTIENIGDIPALYRKLRALVRFAGLT